MCCAKELARGGKGIGIKNKLVDRSVLRSINEYPRFNPAIEYDIEKVKKLVYVMINSMNYNSSSNCYEVPNSSTRFIISNLFPGEDIFHAHSRAASLIEKFTEFCEFYGLLQFENTIYYKQKVVWFLT